MQAAFNRGVYLSNRVVCSRLHTGHIFITILWVARKLAHRCHNRHRELPVIRHEMVFSGPQGPMQHFRLFFGKLEPFTIQSPHLALSFQYGPLPSYVPKNSDSLNDVVFFMLCNEEDPKECVVRLEISPFMPSASIGICCQPGMQRGTSQIRRNEKNISSFIFILTSLFLLDWRLLEFFPSPPQISLHLGYKQVSLENSHGLEQFIQRGHKALGILGNSIA